MKLPNISVKRPIATLMAFTAILLFGFISMTKLPLDIMPEMELPALTIMTIYPGASATEVEQQVTKPLEELLAGTEGLKNISSKSKENVSFISLRFSWGANISDAANNARDFIEFAKRKLPADVYNPVIYKVNSSMFPVLVYGVTAKENYQGINNIIDNKIAGPLKKIEGVGSVMYVGQPTREIKINVNPKALRAYNLSISQIATIIKAENINIPGGNIKVGKNDFAVKVPGKFVHVKDLANISLVNYKDNIIRLKDVAAIVDGFKEKDEVARSKNGIGVALMIQKQSGVNTLEVTNNVRASIKNIQLSIPDDMEIFEIMNTDELIVQSISNLTNTLWWALFFVALVVFIFLREWRSSLIVFLTIPFSLIIAFITMFVIGYTINIFSLMAIIIAIGMVVDNAIVVLENITQHIENGSQPKQAAIFGASEMGQAITASTATTLMVFIPMIFVGGVVGILFKQLAIITSVTMLASLITALSLTPTLSAKLLKTNRKVSKKKHSKLYNLSEKAFISLENIYKNSLKLVVKHRIVTLTTSVVIFIIVLFLGKNLGNDYIPEFDAGDIAIVIETEIGTSAEETDRIAQKVIKIVKNNVPELVPGSLSSISGQTENGTLSAVGFDEGKNISTILAHLVLPDERNRSAKDIGKILREKIKQIPEIEKFHVTAGSLLSEAITGNVKPIEIEIIGNNFDSINSTANKIQEKLNPIEGLIDIQNTVDNGKLEIQINIDKQKASALALNTAMIAMQIRQSIYGTQAGNFTENAEDYEINIRYAPKQRNKIENINNIMITNLRGEQIQLSSLAEINEGVGPLQINHQSQQRIVKVTANIMNISLGEAADKVQKIIDNTNVPPEVNVTIKGQLSKQSESFSDLYLILLIGVLMVYMVMAAQFESFKDPLIIMFAIPYTLVGIILAFLITGQTLSVTTFIGVIMLMGIVVNNGIVLVDYINLLRKRGYNLIDAVVEGGRSRMRPVLMTSFTTILGMLPMALSTGMGHEMYSPLGITIIGGLFISTIITLILIPTIYISFHKKSIKK
ncbi:MAG: efflux RND transporter permease subunit [Bacteroidales bacterium]|jgi:hydrophobe/amphiphile efflux-1 (HAE1) family protein|nr:efflux RND transporter permease subunit [Bacteroidales bacterium]